MSRWELLGPGLTDVGVGGVTGEEKDRRVLWGLRWGDPMYLFRSDCVL